MKSIDQMTQGELAAFIDSHLKESGIHVVLSGGACVAIYSDHKYVSKDLDFIAQFNLDGKKISAAMKTLGFEVKGNYFHHPQTSFFVEFIPGPPSVGQDPIEEIHEKVFATGSLRIISPTDCVKDRLAAYYHWGDRQSLEQAVLVSNSIQVDIDQIENWSTREGKQVEFREFYRLIE